MPGLTTTNVAISDDKSPDPRPGVFQMLPARSMAQEARTRALPPTKQERAHIDEAPQLGGACINHEAPEVRARTHCRQLAPQTSSGGVYARPIWVITVTPTSVRLDRRTATIQTGADAPVIRDRIR